MAPNPECLNSSCRKRQEEWKNRPKEEEPEQKPEAAEPVELHADNEWGIELGDESDLAAGSVAPETEAVNTGGASLSDLMAGLKKLSTS